MASSLIARPKISGNFRTSPGYRTMGFGNTSRILLIGHADGVSINDPIQVNDMQEIVNALRADTDSPLLRALLEVYNAGARDIWICAAAPMDEYVADVDQRLEDTQDALVIDGGTPSSYDQIDIPVDIDAEYAYTVLENCSNFYQKYYERLVNTYAVLADQDFAEVIVPVEASFIHTDNTPFAEQLISFCKDYFENTGTVALGVLGTRKPSTIDMRDSVDEAVSLATSLESSLASKFVIIAMGEGVISVPQLQFSHKASVATSVAANIATLPLDRGIAYSNLSNIVNLEGFDYTDDQLDRLVNSKVNPAVRSMKAKRGAPFQTVLLSDNTLASDGSSFWSLSQMRIVARCSNTIRAMGNSWIGTTDFPGFKQSVFDYMNNLLKSNTIKNFTLLIERSQESVNRVNVDVSITPFYGVRQIYFTVEVGPGV